MESGSGNVANTPDQRGQQSSSVVENVKAGIAHGAEQLADAGKKVLSNVGVNIASHDVSGGTHQHKEGHYPAHQSFEEKVYQDSKGAETPDGTVEKLHVHDARGQEFEGAPISGKSMPFDKPPHGAYANEDKPFKLQSQDHGHDKSGPDTKDASHMSMEGGGQMTGNVSMSGGSKGPETEAAGGTDPPTTIGPHHREEEGVEGHKHGGASSS